jgi:hypothetical protein
MKIKRTTLILMLTAVALGGFVYFYEIRGKQQQAEIQEQQKQIFDFEQEKIQAITIKQESEKLTLKRDPNTEKTIWKITAPTEKEADLPTVEFLLDQLTGLKSARVITTSASQLSEYGLEKPEVTLEVELKDGKTRRLFLGKPDFNGNSIYSQLESEGEPSENLSIILLSVNFKNILTKPVSEWEKQEKPEELSDETEDSSTTKDSSETTQPSPQTLDKSSDKKETNQPSPQTSPEKLEESLEQKEQPKTTGESSKKSLSNPKVSPSPKDNYLLTE